MLKKQWAIYINVAHSLDWQSKLIEVLKVKVQSQIHEEQRSKKDMKSFKANDSNEDQIEGTNQSIRRLVNSIIEWVLMIYVKFIDWSISIAQILIMHRTSLFAC